jgi:3-hydroxybutyryl-CoA dehydrogenase
VKSKPQEKPVLKSPSGVVGMGEMGAVIAACLLAGGSSVIALAPAEAERRSAKRRVGRLLKQLEEGGELSLSSESLLQRLTVAREYSALSACSLVLETVVENLQIKREVIARIEEVVSAATVIGSNTSTLPVTAIQQGARHPGRVLGLHWLSLSPFGRGVEIMPGANTSQAAMERAATLARSCGLEPIRVQRDVPGFIGNRIYYAILREAFHIIESGIATPEDIDKALRNSMGAWLPFAGLFGYLDLNGLQPYPAIMDEILPQLDTATKAPQRLRDMVREGATGVNAGRGFYQYTPAQAKKQQRKFDELRREMYLLMREYSGSPE